MKIRWNDDATELYEACSPFIAKIPAEYTSISKFFSFIIFFANPSAIALLQVFPVHTNIIFILLTFLSVSIKT